MYRDLNDIIPPSRRRQMAGPQMDMQPAQRPAPAASYAPPEPSPEPVSSKPPKWPRQGRTRKPFPYVTALIAVVVIAGCGVVLYAFGGTKVTIVPVTNQATIAADMSATAGTGDIPFQIVTVSKTATVSVPAETTETANDPASGTITVSNKQASAQALIKNTRFATASGLVFRIHDSITVPANGTLKVAVFADEAGDKYNIGPTTFTVPGLQNSKAYTLVTASSDAPMAGGFSGTRPSVGQATKDKQYATLQSSLATDLGKDLAAKTPAGYVLVPGASFTTYAPAPDAAGASGSVALSESGSITAVLFPEDALARQVAFKSVGTYNGQPVTFADVSSLKVTPAAPSIAPDATQFDFNLAGTATIVWQVDKSKVAAAVAGKTRNSAEIALQSLPEVAKATLVLRPFWAGTLPADPAKIQVIVNDPKADASK